jgi:AsmA protein
VKPAPKIFLGLVALLLVLALGVAISVAVLVDPQRFRPLLVEQVRKATGRELTLDGDIGLDFLPCCSIHLGRAAIGNPPGFPAGDLARVEDAALSIRIWPLLTERRIVIGTVSLDGLDANLLVRPDGAANWEFNRPGAAGAPDQQPGQMTDLGGGDFSIDGIRLRRGRVAYRDEQAGSAWRVEDIGLSTGSLAGGKPFDLDLAARVAQEGGALAGSVALKSTARLDPATATLELTKPLLDLDLDLSGTSVPAKSLKVRLGAAALKLESRQETRLRFTGLEGEVDAPGLKSPAGDLKGSFVAGDGSLAVGASNELILPKLTADLEVKGDGIPGGAIAATLAADGLALDLDKMAGAIRTLSADVNGLGARLAVTGGGHISDKGADLAGTLKLDPLSPRSLLAALGRPEPRTADPKALTRLAGSAAWALGKDALELKSLDFRLDDTRLSGSAGIAGFDKPMTRFDLRADQLDVDRYLAPAAGADGQGAGGSAPDPGASGDDIPVETLRGLRLDGRVEAGKLTFAKTHLEDVSAVIRADGGRLRLDPLSAKLYGGSYRGSIAIDATGPKARLVLDQQLDALQVAGLLKDRYQTDKLSGALSGRINATGTGNRSDDILATLAGNVALSLADGVYAGTDLWHEIRSARARLKGDAPPPAPAQPRTPIEAMEIAGTLSDGVLRTDKLLAQVPYIRLSGSGGMNLVARTLDYALQAQVTEHPVFEDGTGFKDIKGYAIPLTLKGPLGQPKIGVDVKGLAAGLATEKLRGKLLKKLGLEEQPEAGNEPATTATPPADGAQPAAEPQKEEKPRDALKRSLRDLLKQKP